MQFINPEGISQLLGRDTKWVYAHATELGGFKIGDSWFFTKRGVEYAEKTNEQMELYNAKIKSHANSASINSDRGYRLDRG